MAQRNASGETESSTVVQVPREDREILAATIGNRKRIAKRRGARQGYVEQLSGYQDAFEYPQTAGHESAGVNIHAVAGVVWLLSEEIESDVIGHTEELIECVERLDRRHDAAFEEERPETTPSEYAVDAIGDAREKLLAVDVDRLPPSVRDRYTEGTQKVLDALGEAEALAGE